MTMTYNDISPRTQAYADKRLLTRAIPNNILGQFGQVRVLPQKNSINISFRRLNKLDPAVSPLTEGVSPSGKTVTRSDIVIPLRQYGDWVGYTDVIEDTREDPLLQEFTDILGEQAGETWDVLRAGVLRAGTNVLLANGTARSDVNTVIVKSLLRRAERILLRQEAKPITSIVKAGPNIGAFPIPPAYVAVCHPDLKMDLEAIADWIPIQGYASTSGLIKGEIGASGLIRFVISNNLTPWRDAGGARGTTLSTSGTNSDVYPVLIFGKDAYGVVELSGKGAVSTYVSNPKASESDPLAQRGTIGWKGYTATAILNDLWMLRVEVAVTA